MPAQVSNSSPSHRVPNSKAKCSSRCEQNDLYLEKIKIEVNLLGRSSAVKLTIANKDAVFMGFTGQIDPNFLLWSSLFLRGKRTGAGVGAMERGKREEAKKGTPPFPYTPIIYIMHQSPHVTNNQCTQGTADDWWIQPCTKNHFLTKNINHTILSYTIHFLLVFRESNYTGWKGYKCHFCNY